MIVEERAHIQARPYNNSLLCRDMACLVRSGSTTNAIGGRSGKQKPGKLPGSVAKRVAVVVERSALQ